jgi:hypothetical protein
MSFPATAAPQYRRICGIAAVLAWPGRRRTPGYPNATAPGRRSPLGRQEGGATTPSFHSRQRRSPDQPGSDQPPKASDPQPATNVATAGPPPSVSSPRRRSLMYRPPRRTSATDAPEPGDAQPGNLRAVSPKADPGPPVSRMTPAGRRPTIRRAQKRRRRNRALAFDSLIAAGGDGKDAGGSLCSAQFARPRHYRRFEFECRIDIDVVSRRARANSSRPDATRARAAIQSPRVHRNAGRAALDGDRSAVQSRWGSGTIAVVYA